MSGSTNLFLVWRLVDNSNISQGGWEDMDFEVGETGLDGISTLPSELRDTGSRMQPKETLD